MKSHWLIDIGVPVGLLVFGLTAAIFLNYLQPHTNWVLAVFPKQTKEPFLAAAPYADAVAADNTTLNAVFAYVPTQEKRSALEQHATLLDPAGVPLCAPR